SSEWSLHFQMDSSGDSISSMPIDAGDTAIDSALSMSISKMDKLCIDGSSETLHNGDAMGEADGTGDGDFFPFLALPTELIRLIFKSHLHVKDRVIARVNHELYELESDDKYTLNRLNIGDSLDSPTCSCGNKDDLECKMQVLVVQFIPINFNPFQSILSATMLLTKSTDVYVYGLKKLTHNSTIHHLSFMIKGTSYGDLLSTVSSMDALKLEIDVKKVNMRKELLTEEIVEELTRGRLSILFRNRIPSPQRCQLRYRPFVYSERDFGCSGTLLSVPDCAIGLPPIKI
ncbi:hypothetical protein PENTCL1PPCAC_23206, partial [Pristionchus entomophagus]